MMRKTFKRVMSGSLCVLMFQLMLTRPARAGWFSNALNVIGIGVAMWQIRQDQVIAEEQRSAASYPDVWGRDYPGDVPDGNFDEVEEMQSQARNNNIPDERANPNRNDEDFPTIDPTIDELFFPSDHSESVSRDALTMSDSEQIAFLKKEPIQCHPDVSDHTDNDFEGLHVVVLMTTEDELDFWKTICRDVFTGKDAEGEPFVGISSNYHYQNAVEMYHVVRDALPEEQHHLVGIAEFSYEDAQKVLKDTL